MILNLGLGLGLIVANTHTLNHNTAHTTHTYSPFLTLFYIGSGGGLMAAVLL